MPQTAYRIDFGQVESIVQDYYMPSIANQWALGNALYMRLKPRIKTYSGGRAIIAPLTFSQEGGGGQWWSGDDKQDTRVRNPYSSGIFYRKNFALPIVLTQDEEDSVGGNTQLMSLLTLKMENARPSVVDAVNQALFNDGTDPRQLGGLQHAIKDNPASSHTYGQITTSSTVNTWWQNQFDATAYTTGSGGSFMLARGGPVSKMWSKIGRASGKRPTMILSNWGSYTDFHDTLVTQERYQRPQQNSDLAKAGFENIMYKNAAWVVDERAPHDSGNVEKIYFVHEPSVRFVVHVKRNMNFVGWREPTDQFIRVAYIQFSAELCLTERRSMGVITNVDTDATS